MRIMSVSKPVTSVGIMKLYEQDPSILKKRVFGSGGILGTKYPTPSGQSKLNKITVEQMLWHISGLRSCNGESVFWDKNSTVADAMSVLMKAGDIMPDDTGAKWTYSNTNYYFLARVIEQVSGLPYETFIRNKVLTPCGIGSSMFLGNADGTPKSGECSYDPATKPNMQLWGGFGGWSARWPKACCCTNPARSRAVASRRSPSPSPTRFSPVRYSWRISKRTSPAW